DLAALYARGLLFGQLSDVLTQVVSGVSQPDTSTDELISILSQKR
ncbi:MAG TPA: sugar ABC transporter substrate-binding protein, partial [Rhodopirellula sp.]|nr:sugar ABC transporter substrate-binding protein [Rhodopirellula sp.]